VIEVTGLIVLEAARGVREHRFSFGMLRFGRPLN
jgi:hypothetical protein